MHNKKGSHAASSCLRGNLQRGSKSYVLDKLNAGVAGKRDTNQRGPEPDQFDNSHKPQRLPVICYTDCNLLYKYAKDFTCMSTICLNLYFAAVIQIYIVRMKIEIMRSMCSVMTWPVGGNICILSGWVSAKELLTAVPGPTFSFKQYSFWKTGIHFKMKTTIYVVAQNILSIP